MPRQSLDGIRVHVILTKYQDRELRKLAKESGMTVAEHIRRGMDFYLASAADRLATK